MNEGTAKNLKTGETFYISNMTCVWCEKDLNETVTPEKYVKLFAAGFCSGECWDNYISTK